MTVDWEVFVRHGIAQHAEGSWKEDLFEKKLFEKYLCSLHGKWNWKGGDLKNVGFDLLIKADALLFVFRPGLLTNANAFEC